MSKNVILRKAWFVIWGRQTRDGIINLLLLIVFLSVNGCTSKHTPEYILKQAMEAMGSQEVISELPYIYADSDCEGPSGPFRTQTWSSKDGRMRFEQISSRYDTKAGISKNGAWLLQGDEIVEVNDQNKVFLQSHEFHMMVLDPYSRLHSPEYLGKEVFNNIDAIVLKFKNILNHQVLFYFEEKGKLPLGLIFRSPFDTTQAHIEVQFSNWETQENGLKLFENVVLTQSDDAFQYSFSKITFSDIADSLFTPAVNLIEGQKNRNKHQHN